MSEFPLPNELIECILDNLYHDKATLLNCALVGKAWVPRSQKGLFQRIVIEAPNSHHEDYVTLATAFLAAYERLLAIYDAKPHLATYARTLELRQYEKPSRTVDAKELQETLQTCTAKVIQRLTNITNLSILRLNWSQINPPMRAALTGVFQIPSVVRVSLSLFAIPTFAELASLLSHVTHLKVLKITFLACHNWDIPLPPSPADDSNPDVRSISTSPPPPRSIHLDELVHLHLVNIRAFTAWFQKDWCPFQVSNLHSLHLHRSATFDYHGTAFMLESIGENLKELELQGPYQSQRACLFFLMIV
ncbi:hypothetical protein GYMLUDRAFT_213194 [Collybiopsis luxurians FD-317 M1]|nr:hypothetical protein GYMLUDRAFT_213194 [Collybiopsis luxurians FD-317 M1]